MHSDKKYRQLESELDRIVRSELSRRAGSRKKRLHILKISDIIETRNREIVEAHQREKTGDILPALFSAYLQTREGGPLFHPPEGLTEEAYRKYRNRIERFETLFSAALMAVKDRERIEIVHEFRNRFLDHYRTIREIDSLCEAADAIRKAAGKLHSGQPDNEETAIRHLRSVSPLKTDLQVIENRSIELRENPYVQEALRLLNASVQAASRAIAEESQNASRYLFDLANTIFQKFKASPATLSYVDGFLAQKEELKRFAKIFDSIGDQDRKEKIEKYVRAVDGALTRLQKEIERQKSQEVRETEKQQQEISDAYDRFLEIKRLFAEGGVKTKGQRKNVAARLRKCRDTLMANGQRIMAREIDRFLNSTAIGKPAEDVTSAAGPADGFDYRKGFWILLPVTILLLMLVAMLLAG